MTEEELDLLLAQDPTIPHHEWGIKGAKSKQQLLSAIQKRECTLAFERVGVPSPSGSGVVRETRVLLLSVYIDIGKNERYMIVEIMHRLANGHVFTRAHEMNVSLTETGIAGESDEEMVVRALAQELQITGLTARALKSLHFFDDSFRVGDNREATKLRPSKSYLGTWTRQRTLRASITLSARRYRPEGYIERVYDDNGVLEKEVFFAAMSGADAVHFRQLVRQMRSMVDEEQFAELLVTRVYRFLARDKE
ncbi:MAG TPA: hypothetical protein VFY28_00095 [Candidatus Paceibacterota bacterium]|nr:hypothetical protein [Candidatus Paceibacterota bacterium]